MKPKFASMLCALLLALAIVPACKASQTPTATHATTSQNDQAPAADGAKSADSDKSVVVERKTKRTRGSFVHTSHSSNNELVSFGQDSMLPAGEKSDAVVSIFGSSTSNGEVSDAVVSVLGSSTSSGTVGDAVVSVLGNTRVNSGTVGDAAVAVMGSTYVNGHVKGDVVAIFGNLELGPDAIVDGEAVCIGGEVKRDPKAVLKGHIQHIAIGGPFNIEGLQAWVKECLLFARPLAFNSDLMWAWYIAFGFLAFYAILSLLAPSGVIRCARTFEERPGYSILACVLVLVLTPIVAILLCFSMAIGIGFVLLPLFSLAMFCAEVFGRVVVLAWIGRRITKIFDQGSPMHPVIAVLIGGAIVLLLYTVPILGFVVYKLIGVIGLGLVVYTLMLVFKGHRKEIAMTAAATAAATPAFVPPLVMPVAVGGVAPQQFFSASNLERAGFWHRFLASLLDFIMVSIVFGLLTEMFHWNGEGGALVMCFAIYNMIMWATRSTTIGGVICGLRLVRLDDRPVDAGIAVVRGLSSFLSLVVAGLGFIWVVFDDHKQSWHDKIAGTTIVKVPKGTSLL